MCNGHGQIWTVHFISMDGYGQLKECPYRSLVCMNVSSNSIHWLNEQNGILKNIHCYTVHFLHATIVKEIK